MTVKVLIINLKKSTDRREFIRKQLRKLDVCFEFVEAYGASEVGNEELNKINLNKPYDYELTKEDVACAMSHAKALTVLANDESSTHGLIIEDDVYLSKDLPGILSQLKVLNKPGNIVLLSCLAFKPVDVKFVSDLCFGYGLARLDHYKVLGAQAYFLSKNSAKRFAEKLLPVTTVADDWHTFMSRKYFSKLYLVYPLPVVHAEFVSVRDSPDSAGIRTIIKNHIIKYKIFPLYQMFFKIRFQLAEKRQRNNISAPDFEHKKTYKL